MRENTELFDFYPISIWDINKLSATDDPKYQIAPIMWEEHLSYGDVDSCWFPRLGDQFVHPDIPFMIMVPLHEQLFTLEQIKQEVPRVEGEVPIWEKLEDTKNDVVFFVCRHNPKEWVGFIAISSDINITEERLDMDLNVSIIYVRNKYRGIGIGSIIARTTAIHISDNFDMELDGPYPEGEAACSISLSAQCSNVVDLCMFDHFHDRIRPTIEDCDGNYVDIDWTIDTGLTDYPAARAEICRMHFARENSA